jgi:small-conductance mechanosensitive channel
MKPRLLAAVCGLLLFVCLPCAPQGHEAKAAVPAGSAQPAAKLKPAPVLLDGKTVIEIEWGLGSISPQTRAEAISERLEKMANDLSQPNVFTTNPTDISIDVMFGDRVMASVFDGDAQRAGVSRELLAREWQVGFTRAVESYRQDHSREKLLERIALIVAVVVVALAILWLLGPLARWATGRVTNRIVGTVQSSKRQGFSLIDVEQLRGMIRLGFSTVRLAVSVFVLYLAFELLFSIFPRTRAVGDIMLGGVLGPARQFIEAAWRSTPSLVFIVIIAIACRYILHLVSFAFSRIRDGHVRVEGFKPQWASTTQRLVSIAIVLMAALVAYPYIPGSQSAAFKGISLFVGVLVSLGSTGVVSNVLNGVVLTYMDSFEVGDFIQIGETQGYVEATSLFVTRLKTRQGRVITIPNSMVLSSQITNYSQAAGDKTLSLSAMAGIGYDTPWRQVEAMLLNAAKKTQTVRETPAPFVLELSLDSFQITYELTVFLTGEMRIAAVRAELNRNILDEFNVYGVQIMTPSYVADPPKPLRVEKDNWYAAPSRPGGGDEPPTR